MPDIPVPISQMPQATLPLTGDEITVIVQDGVTKRVDLTDILPPATGLEVGMTLSGVVNDLDLTGYGRVLINTNGGALTLTGVLATFDGDLKYLTIVGANSMLAQNENIGSAAGNRLYGVDDIGVVERGTLTIVYSGILSRWIMLV